MSMARSLIDPNWKHDEGADKIEYLCIQNPALAAQMQRLALRFISEKGLSLEFSEALREVEELQASSEMPSP